MTSGMNQRGFLQAALGAYGYRRPTSPSSIPTPPTSRPRRYARSCTRRGLPGRRRCTRATMPRSATPAKGDGHKLRQPDRQVRANGESSGCRSRLAGA